LFVSRVHPGRLRCEERDSANLKFRKLYHGEIGVINRTFGAARRSRVVKRQVARLRDLNRRFMASDASIDAERGKDLAENRQTTPARATVVRRLRICGRAATAADRPGPVDGAGTKIPFSGGGEPV